MTYRPGERSGQWPGRWPGISAEDQHRLVDLARRARHVRVLTGAGMSAESGMPTFRASQTGLWEQFEPSKLATPDAWEADPELVWAWYVWRLGLLRRVEPNAGHRALARWAAHTDLQIITQNVDDLHERAGSRVLTHLHGSLRAFRCSGCATPYLDPIEVPAEQQLRLPPPSCPACGEDVRPGVVWFGEGLPEGAFDAAVDAVFDADLVLVVGTSGMVFPASTLPDLARGHGVPVVELNPEPTALSVGVDIVWRDRAAEGLPRLVDAVLATG